MVKFVPASEFTVGWVCALPIELAAAAEILDEEYSSVQKHASDPNIYTLGRIGGLNVVIASLPGGKTGTNQAAIVAVQMKMTFGSLRFSILVGVGGGVPNPDNDDIRLGDVVISQPYGEHGGIVQYDSGKLVPGGQTRTGSLSSPDSTFLQAAAILRSNQYRKKLGSVYSHLNKICSNPEFSPPGPEQDVLYTASTEHFGSASNCERCPADGIIPRAPRPNTFPKAFFGTIASGNLVIKDGEARDKLSKNLGGVLCFEMEAAGLIASNSSMVVRGICDYADAHKNKQWQPYAAAVAAAFAKELLLIISPDVAARQDEATESPSHGIRSNAEPSREKKEPRSHGHRGSGTSTKADKKSRNRDRDTTWSGWSDWQWSDEQGCYYAVRTNERGDLEYTFGVPDGSTVAGSADPGEATPAALDLQPANVASENELQWYPQELTMASTSAQGQNVASTSSNGFTLESSSYAPGLDCHPSTMYHDPSQEEHAFIMAVPDEWTRLYGQPQQAADAAPRRHRRDKKAAPKGKTSSSHRHD